MERKEQKVEMTVNVTAFRENDGYRKKPQKGGEKSERRLEIML